MSSLCDQVDRGFRRRDDQWIEKIFNQYSTMTSPTTSEKLIPKESLACALNELSIFMDDSNASHLFTEMDVNNDGGLSSDEFKRTVHVAYERVLGPYELWARSLPLAQILADALPSPTGVLHKDRHLRFVSNFQGSEIEEVVRAFATGLKRMLQESCSVLKQAYEEMDRNKGAGAGDKFEVFTASCGRIQDFHKGMTQRVGKFILPSPRNSSTNKNSCLQGYQISTSSKE